MRPATFCLLVVFGLAAYAAAAPGSDGLAGAPARAGGRKRPVGMSTTAASTGFQGGNINGTRIGRLTRLRRDAEEETGTDQELSTRKPRGGHGKGHGKGKQWNGTRPEGKRGERKPRDLSALISQASSLLGSVSGGQQPDLSALMAQAQNAMASANSLLQSSGMSQADINNLVSQASQMIESMTSNTDFLNQVTAQVQQLGARKRRDAGDENSDEVVEASTKRSRRGGKGKGKGKGRKGQGGQGGGKRNGTAKAGGRRGNRNERDLSSMFSQASSLVNSAAQQARNAVSQAQTQVSSAMSTPNVGSLVAKGNSMLSNFGLGRKRRAADNDTMVTDMEDHERDGADYEEEEEEFVATIGTTEGTNRFTAAVEPIEDGSYAGTVGTVAPEGPGGKVWWSHKKQGQAPSRRPRLAALMAAFQPLLSGDLTGFFTQISGLLAPLIQIIQGFLGPLLGGGAGRIQA